METVSRPGVHSEGRRETYGDDFPQAVEHVTVVPTVEELLDVLAGEGPWGRHDGGVAHASSGAGGLGSFEGEVTSWREISASDRYLRM